MPRSASRWARIMARTPARPRSKSRFSSRLVKGLPSPVPCNSMNSPRWFITRFISVWARLSS